MLFRSQLGLVNFESVITGFARPNLQFGVIQANGARKPQLVIDAINSVRDEAGIIYVGTRAKADELTQILLEHDIEAVVYHAGMELNDRKWVQENFMNGQAKVIVATNAFGLGIDKHNIRFVIHYDMPGTIEAYYQEAGRAGRDGKQSFCLLLYSPKDRYLREFFIKGDNPPLNIILEIYEILTSNSSDTVLLTYTELAEMLSEQVPDMAIGTSLKILEREGYISRPNEKSGSAYLKLTVLKDEILKSLSVRAKKQIFILNKLYERFASELNNGWNFNPEEVAEIIGAKKETMLRLIRNLSDLGLAEYKPPFKGTEIRILKRVEPDQININFNELKEKLKKAYKKLDMMENYIYHLDCRQKYILDYFGDTNSKLCNQCDNCLTSGGYIRKYEQPKKRIKHSGRFSADKRGSNLKVTEPERRPLLNTKLTQLETLELYNKGFSIKKVVDERGLKIGTIVAHICFLIEKKLIKPEEVDKLVGLKSQKKIIQAGKEVGFEKLKPIFDYLGEEFSYEDIRLTLTRHKIA